VDGQNVAIEYRWTASSSPPAPIQCDELTPLRIEHRGLSPLRAISAADRPGFSGTISLP
jgi:hypothetical protein